MIDLLLNSGLLSVTLWVALLTLAAVLVSWLRTPTTEQPAPAVPPFVTTSLFVAFLAAGTVVSLGYGLYRAYISPRDLLQDIVSAQEYLAGRSLFPDHMNELMRQAVAEEPRPSPFWWAPQFQEREARARERTFTEHWVQAHPPPMTLFVAPFVAHCGILGTQVVILLLSLAALALTLVLLGRGLEWKLARRQWLILVLAVLGAEPIVTTLRSGQTGLLLGGLMVVGWYALKRGRPLLAGVAVGLATGLKLFPGLLLIYFLLRQRKAFAAAAGTLLVLVLLVGTLTGWHTFAEYTATTRGVVDEYAQFPNNLSLLGLAARTLEAPGTASGKARVFFYLLALAAIVAAALVSRRGPQPSEDNRSLDIEYALFVALMPLLSPISWDHYLSVLLLPLAVLGTRTLTAAAPWSAVLGFVSIVVVLILPDTTFVYFLPSLGSWVPRPLLILLVLPLRTYALLGLSVWLGLAAVRAKRQALSEEMVPARAVLAGVLLVLALAHVAAYVLSEPYFNGDETRHLMTGVYVRDVLVDRPVTDLHDYSVRYYLQYPALGLLVWPPFFYFVEGLFMLTFGTCFLAARVLVGLFAVMACVYLFLLARKTHGTAVAALGVLFFGLSPLVFQFSAQVMLEVPALTLVLMAVYHCQRYLDEERRLHLALCCLATALAALTRFDGVFLAPLFLIWLAGVGKLRLLRRREVLLGMAGALLLVAPFYLLTALNMGGAHLKAVKEGTNATSTGFFVLENFGYYPLHIPEQIGWFLVLPALVGLAAALRSERRPVSWPYLALVAATYLTFTPLAELEPRHAIYWVPALAVFAADGCLLTAWGSPRWRFGLVLAVVVGPAWQTACEQGRYVRGYDKAARYVVDHTTETPVILFDGFLTGDFIYQVRRLDPERKLWVLRGDKLFYGMLSDPHGGYEEWAPTEAEILDLLFKYDPEYIVVEEPQIYFELPAAQQLRRTLEAHRERFSLVETIPIDSNHETFQDNSLWIYRNLLRNPHREEIREMRMLGLGRSLRR
jgi:4-amino-4-deoxy-L-arabinose transferase-like glycosyltransferase